MTRVKMIERDGETVGFEAEGHSDYADSGEDIVCAAVSALTQTCEIGLRDVLGLDPEVRRDDGRGAYRVVLPDGVSKSDMDKARIIFDTMSAGLHSIELGYPDFVRIDAKNRRWN